jgi:putative ABC transport system permease protein
VTPPPRAERLIRHAVAADAAGLSIVGDLRQEFAEQCRSGSVFRARYWYWRQALSIWWWSAWGHPSGSHHSPRGGALFDIVGDIRHASRVVVKAPGQALLMIATLAVGIGFTTIGFSFADTVFLRGMPIANPDNIVRVFGVDVHQPERRAPLYASDYLDFRERARSVEELCAFAQSRVTLRRSGHDTVRITIGNVTGDLFGLWGLGVQLGRGLRPGEDRPGAMRVAVLSDRFWRDAFNRSPTVLGEAVMLDGVAHEIVGVMSSDVEFANFADLVLWVPASLRPGHARDLRGMLVTGRLAAGATVADADAEFRVLAQALADAHPETNRGRQALVLPVTRALGGPNLLLVMTLLVGTATLVTVIAGVNVAGVLLARAVVRQREFAMRIALGARKTRVFRQLVAEGLLVAAAGGAGGMFVAEIGLRLIRSVDAEPVFKQIVIDWHEAAFVTALVLVSPLVFSLAPALAAMRLNLVGTLNAASSRMAGSSRRGRELLVTAQLALAIALAVVGGLVARTASVMMRSPSGFESSDVLTFVVALDQHSPDAAARRRVLRDLVNRLSSAGPLAVGTLDAVPAVTMESPSIIQPAEVAARDGQTEAWAHIVAVDEGAFQTLAVPIIEGRPFTRLEIETDAPEALVSLETARRYFGGARAALGRGVMIVREGVSRLHQVIGVTGDVRNTDPEHGMPPRVWVPMFNPRTVTVVVRTAGDTNTAAGLVRRVAREVLPDVAVESLESYDQAISRRTAGDRVAMGMLVAFSLAALLFATTGLYGTVALSANMRRAEFATRVALGARVGDVAALVVRQAFRLLAAGAAVGLAGGVLAGSAMRRLLYGVTPFDPVNLLTVLALLAGVMLLASVGPALRAARVDVIQAIRAE